MESEALKKVRDAEQFTIMLDELTDEAKRRKILQEVVKVLNSIS